LFEWFCFHASLEINEKLRCPSSSDATIQGISTIFDKYFIALILENLQKRRIETKEDTAKKPSQHEPNIFFRLILQMSMVGCFVLFLSLRDFTVFN